MLAVLAGLLAGGAAVSPPASAATIATIAPASPPVPNNCFPFGDGGSGEDPWTPYMGFVYKNVPAFQLKTGDGLAFDVGIMNAVDVQLEIALAATTVNGGSIPAAPFTTVVPNTQTPANPKGDSTVGNYELKFTLQAPFSFPGGGMIIRFSNPSAAYAVDEDCDDGQLISGTGSDSSGFFVERFYSDSDGAYPWSNSDTGDIAAFRLSTPDPPVGQPPGNQPGTKKKCKKKKVKKKGAAAAKKKKCKKKNKK